MDENKLYTVILTDPDAKDRKEHKFREWCHWVVINVPIIKNNDENIKGKYIFDTSSGQDVVEYVGSGPPNGTGFHRYVYLVYEQNKKINIKKCGQEKLIAKGGGGKGRAKWKATKFAQNNNLNTLIAGNFYKAKYDDYVPKLYAMLKGK